MRITALDVLRACFGRCSPVDGAQSDGNCVGNSDGKPSPWVNEGDADVGREGENATHLRATDCHDAWRGEVLLAHGCFFLARSDRRRQTGVRLFWNAPQLATKGWLETYQYKCFDCYILYSSQALAWTTFCARPARTQQSCWCTKAPPTALGPLRRTGSAWLPACNCQRPSFQRCVGSVNMSCTCR